MTLQTGPGRADTTALDAEPESPGVFGVNLSLLEALGFDPVGLDALQARGTLDTASLQAELMNLELEGLVARLPGGLFQRLTPR